MRSCSDSCMCFCGSQPGQLAAWCQQTSACWHTLSDMGGALGSYAIPGAGATLEATEAALREQTAALAHDGPSAVELERMRKARPACRACADAWCPTAPALVRPGRLQKGP
jgi:hypothetical protein